MANLQMSDIPAFISNYTCLSVFTVSQSAKDEAFKLFATVVCGLLTKFFYEFVEKKQKKYRQRRLAVKSKPHSITSKNIEDEKKISEQISSDQG